MTKFVDEAEKDWGLFRTFISNHPLTGFWMGIGVGAVIGWFAHVVI